MPTSAIDTESLLRRAEIFQSLDDGHLSLLAAKTRTRAFSEDQVIILRNEPGGTLFILLQGMVKVHAVTQAGDEVIFAILRPFEVFGELSTLDGLPRAADVTALEPVECLILDAQSLRDAITASPPLAWSIIETLTRRLRAQNAMTESLATLDVTGRVADLLARLAQTHGMAVDGDAPAPGKRYVICLALTQQDIAAFVGATRERVGQSIRSLRRSGYLANDPSTGRVLIPDLARLEQLARNR